MARNGCKMTKHKSCQFFSEQTLACGETSCEHEFRRRKSAIFVIHWAPHEMRLKTLSSLFPPSN